MQRIKQLPIAEIQKIAAGEVVERPANVVKELLENSIDAGATQITIYLKDAGKDLIRIVDNGHGMSAEDAHLSIAQHATSKISSVDDLKTLQTFGFRGEALSSISAVSAMTLITKEASALQGIKLTINAGTIQQESFVSCNTGTDISIADLFFNVPARKKFLKKRETELNQIQHLIHAFCLLHRSITFTLFHEDRQLVHCPANDDLIVRYAQLWDHTMAQHMMPYVDAKTEHYFLEGALSNHHFYRYDRNSIFIFVNKRWIKNYALSKSLLKGYANVLPPGRYPAACINITVPSEQVDINIHPRKEEVQFLHPRTIEKLIQEATKKTLETHLSQQLKKSVSFNPAPALSYEQAFQVPIKIPQPEPIDNLALHNFNFDAPVFSSPSILEKTAEAPSAPLPEKSMHIVEQEDVSYTVIGHYHKTYILLEHADGLFFVDQHAAHERILYELFAQRFNDIATVQLLFPQLITFTPHHITTLLPYIPFFAEHGIIFEQFSDNQITLQAIPVHLKDQSIEELIKEVISWIEDNNALEKNLFTKKIHEKLQAQMACKAAVKAGDSLTQEKMQQLIHDLVKTENRFTCPHGRPTGWLLNLTEIEKKFKRNYEAIAKHKEV